jgi:hypothetical protein
MDGVPAYTSSGSSEGSGPGYADLAQARNSVYARGICGL